jgi:hypothetical protein
MTKVIGMALLAILLVLPLAGPAAAKQVYLSDGGIIECQSFRMVKGNVVVWVNRDSVIELSRGEVDMKRTFHRPKAVGKGRKPHAIKHGVNARPMAQPLAKVPAPFPSDQTRPARAPASKTATRQQEAEPALPAVQAPQTRLVNLVTAPMPPRPSVPLGTNSALKQPAASAPQGASLASDEAMRQHQEKMGKEMEKAVTQTVSSLPLILVKVFFLSFIESPFVQIVLLMILLTIATFWKVFTKAGEEGWKGIIPIYNLFVLMKIAGKPWWWGLLLFVPILGLVIAIFYNLALAERFGKGQLFGLGLCFLPLFFFGMLAFSDAEYR